MGIRLFRTHTLPITRANPNSGYKDPTTKRWVRGTDTVTNVQGNLQPYRAGITRMELPEGVMASDARLFITKTLIQTATEQTNTEADSTTIDGLVYECFNVEPWQGYNLKAEHYYCIFIRRDKLRSLVT